MLYNRFLLFAAAIGFGITAANAQDAVFPYYISNLTTQGTARSMGFGNALGSIGGDFSSASVNPAGLGIFRSSEFSFTPSMKLNSSSTLYQGVVTDDNNVRFNINSFGMVFTDAPKGKRYERRAWKTISFAIGFNRVADLNRDYSYRGVNSTSSATLAFEADANRYPADPGSSEPLSVPGYMGYQSYLIDRAGSNTFATIVPYKGGVNQEKTVRERGRVNEWVFSLGGNYREQLMLGATLGIPSIRYSVTSNYSESVAAGNNQPNPNNFSSFRYRQELDITGVGINMKLGAIYKATDNIRIGAALHTPSYYALNEEYTPSISSVVGGQSYEINNTNGRSSSSQFNYGLTTPWRGILSASYIFKGKGFITADYEYADYGFMQFSYPWADGSGNSYEEQEAAMNSTLTSMYKGTSNFRLGAEALLTKYFMARAGFGYYSNAFANSSVKGERMDFSGGIGFRSKDFFADIALIHSAYQLQNTPYYIDYDYVLSTNTTSPAPVATTDFGINNIAMTVGVKF